MAREWSTEEADDVIDSIDNVYEGLEYDSDNRRVLGELWAVDTDRGIDITVAVDSVVSTASNNLEYTSYRACLQVGRTDSAAVQYSRSSKEYTSPEQAIEQARGALAYAWRQGEQLLTD